MIYSQIELRHPARFAILCGKGGRMKLARWLMGLGIMATLLTVSSPMANAAGNAQQKN
jgi:hypothetical protein